MPPTLPRSSLDRVAARPADALVRVWQRVVPAAPGGAAPDGAHPAGESTRPSAGCEDVDADVGSAAPDGPDVQRAPARRTPGQLIADARVESGHTLEDLSRATRIRPHLLAAMEADDFTGCGGDFYARGHLRSLAALLGIDAGPVLAAYEELRSAGVPALGRAPFGSADTGPEAAPSRVVPSQAARPATDPPRPASSIAVPSSVQQVPQVPQGPRGARRAGTEPASRPARPVPQILLSRPGWLAAGVLAAAAVVGFGAVELLADSGRQGPALPPVGARVPHPEYTAPAGPAAGPSAAPITYPPGVTLHLAVSGSPSWVRVRNGGATGRVVFEGTLPPGSTRDFFGRRVVSLVTGNPAALTLTVNGHPVGPIGTVARRTSVVYTWGTPPATR